MLREGILCLEEGIVRRPRDVDAGMIFGTGFPPFRGGLLRYADQLGARTCLEKLQALTEKHGSRFEPPAMLKKLAESDARFYP